MNKICDECETVAHCTKHGCIPKVSAKDAMKLANEFNRYFTSKNGVDVPARISVPRDEWRELFAALAEQPAQQEPVFWYRPVGYDGGYEGPIHNSSIEKVRKMAGTWKPLYTSQQPAVQEPVTGLLVGQDSDGRYVSIAANAHADTLPLGEYKLYTTPQPAQQQEPIYQYQMANGSWIDQTKESHDYNVRHGQATVRVVYTSPPASKPLTDDEIRGLTPKPDGVAESDPRHVEVLPGVMGTEYDEVDAWSMPLVLQIARAIEAKLKAKNGIKENT